MTRFSAAQLEEKAEAEMQRRIEAGITDDVEYRQGDAPAFDQALVGKWLEVLWRYWEKLPDGSFKPHYIWSSGVVKRVADGIRDRRSKKGQAILPGGAVLWAWDADPEFDETAGEQLLVLLPQKWNPTTHKTVYSWRWDPRELGATQAPTPDQRRKHAARVQD